jgi:TonB family protein
MSKSSRPLQSKGRAAFAMPLMRALCGSPSVGGAVAVHSDTESMAARTMSRLYAIAGFGVVLVLACGELAYGQQTVDPRDAPTVQDEYDPVELGIGPINHCAVAYPEGELQRGQAGWVLVAFRIDSNGQARDIKVIDSSPEEVFDQAALAGMSGCRYRPSAADINVLEGRELRVVVHFDPTFE